MSIEALNWALEIGERYGLKPTTRHVLTIMGNRADEEGSLFPSIRWIRRRTGLAESVIREHIVLLANHVPPLITKEVRSRDDGGQTSNTYRLAVQQPGLAFGIPPSDSRRGVNDTRKGSHRQPVEPPPAGGGQETKERKQDRSSLRPRAADSFDAAWKAYPKRAGNDPRRRAVKAWNARIDDGVNPQDLLAAVSRYSAFCEATGKLRTETVMMAATFFGADKPYEQDWALPSAPSTGTGWWSTQEATFAECKRRRISTQGETWERLKQLIRESIEKERVPA